MAARTNNLFNGESCLKESASAFVTQVMKKQILGSQRFFQGLQYGCLRSAGRAADLVHVLDVQVDDVAEGSSLYDSTRLR